MMSCNIVKCCSHLIFKLQIQQQIRAMKYQIVGESQIIDEYEIKPRQRSNLGLFKLFLKTLDLGVITFGPPLTQINILYRRFVDELKIVSDQQFFSLLVVLFILPGSMTTQLLVALSVITAKSHFSGLMAFFCYSIPFSIVMYNLSISDPNKNQMQYYHVTYYGFRLAAFAMSFRTIFKFFQRNLQRSSRILIVPIAAYLFYFNSSYLFVLTIFSLCGIIGLIRPKFTHLYLKASSISYQFGQQIKDKQIIWITLLAFLLALIPSFSTQANYSVVRQLYRAVFLSVATSEYGVAQLAGTNLVDQQLITSLQLKTIWSRSLIYAGPQYKFGVAFATVVDPSISSAILGYMAVFIPTLLVVFSLMIVWQAIRKNYYARNMLYPMNFAFIGFYISSLIKQTQEQFDSYLKIIYFVPFLVLLSYLYFRNTPSIIVLVIGRIIYPQLSLLQQL